MFSRHNFQRQQKKKKILPSATKTECEKELCWWENIFVHNFPSKINNENKNDEMFHSWLSIDCFLFALATIQKKILSPKNNNNIVKMWMEFVMRLICDEFSEVRK